MDLRIGEARPSNAERDAVDSVLGREDHAPSGGGQVGYGGRRLAAERRRFLLPALHALQLATGWISRGGLGYLCERLDVAPAEAYGVASAYALFCFEPSSGVVVHVCDDVACRVAGGGSGLPAEPGGGVEFRPSPCLGHCEHGSAALVERYGPGGGRSTLAPFSTAEAAAVAAAGEHLLPDLSGGPGSLVPQAGSDRPALRLLRRVGAVDPGSLDAYRASGGYEALRRAIDLGPAGVIAELKAARLLGRGGAAFPTGAKWEAVARNPVRPHYFVANADESEPGTFKDRVLLEEDPFALVEALTVAGLSTGAELGYVYLRGEYPLAERRLGAALSAARARGLLGADVMGSGLGFDIEICSGAGAYIAGEETALFNSIEGRRPEPRNKPPYPADRGLFGRPTGVNNVETLACVLEILRGGAEAFAAIGTGESTGTRLFCLSGRVRRPGLYEVPLGTPLAELLELAGGTTEGRPVASVLLGGAAGTFLGPDELDLGLSFEDARRAGVSLGSGVVVVLDDTVELWGVLRRIARFFRDESCGQCVPCRVGTVRQEELLARMAGGRAREGDAALLADLGAVMRDASICGLGQTAGSAVASALVRGLLAPGEAP